MRSITYMSAASASTASPIQSCRVALAGAAFSITVMPSSHRWIPQRPSCHPPCLKPPSRSSSTAPGAASPRPRSGTRSRSACASWQSPLLRSMSATKLRPAVARNFIGRWGSRARRVRRWPLSGGAPGMSHATSLRYGIAQRHDPGIECRRADGPEWDRLGVGRRPRARSPWGWVGHANSPHPYDTRLPPGRSLTALAATSRRAAAAALKTQRVRQDQERLRAGTG